MYYVLSLMIFNPLPRAYLHLSKVSSTCTLLSLHRAAITFTTIAAINVIRKEHGPSWLLPDLICQPIHNNCKQDRDQSPTLVQSYTNVNSPSSYLLGPSSVSGYPSTCPLPLSHTSLLFFSLLYVGLLPLNPNDFKSFPQSIPPPIQAFLHLHPALDPCIQQQQQQQQQQQCHPQRAWSMGTLAWPHLLAYPSQLQTRKGSEPILGAILHS